MHADVRSRQRPGAKHRKRGAAPGLMGVAVFVAGILLAGCAAAGTPGPSPTALPSTGASPSSGGSPSAAPPQPSSTASSVAPSEVAVTCGAGAPALASPRVAAAADGVHFVVTGPAGWSFGVESDLGRDGMLLSTGPERVTLLVPPGDVQVLCGEAASTAPGVPTTLRVEDPQAFYRPADPGPSATRCVVLTADYGPDPPGIKGDPITITRAAVHGLTTGDSVERAGYPSQAGLVRIVQGGNVIGSVRFDENPTGGWLFISSAMCEGLFFERP